MEKTTTEPDHNKKLTDTLRNLLSFKNTLLKLTQAEIEQLQTDIKRISETPEDQIFKDLEKINLEI